MLCDECKKNEATFSVTVTSGDEVNTRHLCAECMKKMELSLTQGDIQSFLSSILSVLANATSDDSPVCGGCGLHYSEFERTGKLGCAQCYQDFAEQLKPLLQRIHGCTQHVGRVPAEGGNLAQAEGAAAESGPEGQALANETQGENGCESEKQLEILRKKMDDAVACENFEDAAKYRDELRALTAALEGGGGK